MAEVSAQEMSPGSSVTALGHFGHLASAAQAETGTIDVTVLTQHML